MNIKKSHSRISEKVEVPSERETKTEWIKFQKVRQMHFVGKDTLAFFGGCHIVFYDVIDGIELTYRANSYSRGDGVDCFAGHRGSPIFAFAEKCYNPRILVITYPTFNQISSLKGGSKSGYLSLAFTEMEHLISLGAHPNFEITVWSWRSGEKLTHHNTGSHNPNQQIRCSVSTPTIVSQMVARSHVILLWEVHLCYKRCLLTKHEVQLPDPQYPACDFIWAPDGVLHVVDTVGNVYTVEMEKYKLSLSIATEETEHSIRPSIAWFRAGIVISGPYGEVKHYKRNIVQWTESWSVSPKQPFATMIGSSAKDLLLGMTVRGELIQVKLDPNVTLQRLENYGNQITTFTFIFPDGEYIATLNAHGDLMVWEKQSGKKVGGEPLGKYTITLASNPVHPYLALGRSDGALDFVNVYQPYKPKILATLVLSHEAISYIQFTPSGLFVVAATKSIGQFFLIQSTPGDIMAVLGQVVIGDPIVDFSIMENDALITLGVLMMTKKCCSCGDIFHIYTVLSPDNTITHKATIPLDNHYVGICANPTQSEIFYAMPHRSRQLHTLRISNPIQTLDLINTRSSGHQLRKFYMQYMNKYLISFGMDGIIFLHSATTEEHIAAIIPHHRKDNGVRKAIVDPINKYIISLGRDHHLVCTCIRVIKEDDMTLQTSLHQSLMVPEMSTMYTTKRTSGFKLVGADEGKTWLEIQDEVRVLQDRMSSAAKRNKILEEFSHLRKKMLALLEKNYIKPPEEQLPIKAFDLDVEIRQKRTKESEEEIEKMASQMKALTIAQDKLCGKLKQITWTIMEVKAQRIKAILGIFYVENYALLPDDKEHQEKLALLLKRRILLHTMSKQRIFCPWIPKSESKLQLELAKGRNQLQQEGERIREAMQEVEHEHVDDHDFEERKYTFSGSSSHNFVEMLPYHVSQFEMVTYIQAQQEIILLRKVTRDLREFFNKQFTEVFLLKEREMNLVLERNTRLRYILSELNDTERIVSDPEWSSFERPETIITVLDQEVAVLPYISPSQQEILDIKAAEDEARRLAELADNFRERALIEMMDGVLELRWEDKIKKDIPRPKCMIDKEPEDWNEEDLRTVKDYEEKVKFLMSERERYRKMCDAEFKKLSNILRESALKFDTRLADLFLLKIKIESCIDQENLKILRMKQKSQHRITKDMEEHQAILNITESEQTYKDLHTELLYLHESTSECRIVYETLVARDKLLDKGFKKEFPELSPFIIEQIYKMYKRRPKMHQRAQMSVILLNELSRCSVTSDKPSFLPSECLDFLKGLDHIDNYTNAPPNVDEEAWSHLTRVRRLKVECELKIKACALELAEAESTVSIYQKRANGEKERHHALLYKLEAIRNEKLLLCHNVQVQIIMKQGLVEVPTSGTVEDFGDSILINRINVESINSVILEAGRKKLNAMHEMTNFHRVIMCKEWEHKKLKLQIENLRDHLKTVEGVKVTKDIQMYLRKKAMGIADDKGGVSIEKEVAIVRETLGKLLNEIKTQLEEIESKIEAKIKANQILDREIAYLNVDVNEQQLERDLPFETKESEGMKKRMAILMKRSRLVAKIQKQHNDILVLQTELELIRLKTYPTLKYTTLV